MERDGSFELDTTAGDWGLPIATPWNPPPLQPSHVSRDMLQSAEAMELEAWELPPGLSSAPSDVELVQNYLRPAIQRIPAIEEKTNFDWYSNYLRWTNLHALVNVGLPYVNPWELPGVALKEGRREKYYLTDQLSLRYGTSLNLTTPNGFWNNRGGWTRAIRADDNSIIGAKKTLNFYTGNTWLGTRTNWVMNVYSVNNEDSFVENELVMCHVFESDLPDYDDCQRCCNEGLSHREFSDKWIASFSSTPPGSSPLNHHPDWLSDPRYTSYMANIENLLFHDHDHGTSMDTQNCSSRKGTPPTGDHGQSIKRKKRCSDVWDYFTKMFARNLEGDVLTLAACNHCSKILTGGSKGGTTHLARHACPCKFKPVQAGRLHKSKVNVLSSQASLAWP